VCPAREQKKLKEKKGEKTTEVDFGRGKAPANFVKGGAQKVFTKEVVPVKEQAMYYMVGELGRDKVGMKGVLGRGSVGEKQKVFS